LYDATVNSSCSFPFNSLSTVPSFVGTKTSKVAGFFSSAFKTSEHSIVPKAINFFIITPLFKFYENNPNTNPIPIVVNISVIGLYFLFSIQNIRNVYIKGSMFGHSLSITSV
jgi:hypothetical protein